MTGSVSPALSTRPPVGTQRLPALLVSLPPINPQARRPPSSARRVIRPDSRVTGSPSVPATPIGHIVDLAASMCGHALGGGNNPSQSPAVRARQPPARTFLQICWPHSVLRRPARHVTCLPACAIGAWVGPSFHPGLGQRVGAGSSRGSSRSKSRPTVRGVRDRRSSATAPRAAMPGLRRGQQRQPGQLAVQSNDNITPLRRSARPIASTIGFHRYIRFCIATPHRAARGLTEWLGISRKRRTVWDACDKRYPIERPRSRRLPRSRARTYTLD